MRQLESKDIAAYLPYGLMVIVKDEDIPPRIGVATSINVEKYTLDITTTADRNFRLDISDIKPILHPMSNLTKDITVEGYNEGKPFVPSKVMNLRWYGGEFGIVEDVADEGEYPKIAIMPTDYIDYIDSFNQWHFDYRKLIGQGLAVDINTLKL